ncbi:hypothetical protein C8J56DRAFT_785691 [Mycena floridula]|nr:hypothetical protein C8J56DRAFT_785691 [Mycena floridula]
MCSPLLRPANSFQDLFFLIAAFLADPNMTVAKFLIFFNSRAEAQAGAEYLRQHLPPRLRDKIKWFHSDMTDEF